MCSPGWLPALVPLSDYSGDWPEYLEAIYALFKRDFIDSKPMFRGQSLRLKRHPISDGKEATFWHMTSEGKTEADRTPDMRRMERIQWPKPVIENEADPALKIWSEKRGSSNRIHIWLASESYLVVLDERKDYYLPWTAFYVEREHERRKLNKRWERNRER